MTNTPHGKILWILDNGHGIDTPGKKAPMLTDGRQFQEYRFNREVVSKIISLLEEKGLRSFQLVPEEKDISPSIRVRRANKLSKTNPCVIVAVHSNAYGDGIRFTRPRGIETYYYETSTAGWKIAEIFQWKLVRTTGWKDRGVRRGNFQIISDSAMPAIVTECGFYTNREQLQYLLDPAWREMIAVAHVEAIQEIEEMGPGFFQS